MAWQDELDSAYEAIKNRKEFSYDPQTDAGYKAYEQAYMNLGKRAMKDTVGQASAMTGGYGNSYAQTAGQQAYNNYAGQAAQAIPTFQNMALQQYQMEGDKLRDRYSMAKDGRDFDYQQERDRIADDQWQQSFNYQKERDAVADSQWQREFDSTYERWKQQFDYQKSRDAVSDAQWQREFDSTYEKWKQQFAYQKSRDAVSDAQWQQNMRYQQSRDAVSDAQWQQNMQYQQSRDAVSDSQWDKTFAYQQSRDKVADSQWRETFDYQKSQDAADRAYKYATLNKGTGSEKSTTNNPYGLSTSEMKELKNQQFTQWEEDVRLFYNENGYDAARQFINWAEKEKLISSDYARALGMKFVKGH